MNTQSRSQKKLSDSIKTIYLFVGHLLTVSEAYNEQNMDLKSDWTLEKSDKNF